MRGAFPKFGEVASRLEGCVPAPFEPHRLPPVARRWLERSLPPDRPASERVLLEISGEIKLASWTPFRSREILAPRAGFAWQASAGRFPAAIRGMDYYLAGQGGMRWRLAGLIPVMHASGPEVSRSARGRVAGEAALCPGALAGSDVLWRDEDDRFSVASWDLDGERMAVRFEIAHDGALRSASLARWGDHGGKGWRLQPFGALVEEERAFDGVTIPSRIRAGWGLGTSGWSEGEFFRARVEDARWL